MEQFYIKVNDNFVEIKKNDIDEIISPLIYSILKKRESKIDNNYNYSYIGDKLKIKCNNLGFILYNKEKKRRNINNYLYIYYSGLKKYLANYN
tara:strand:+ start:1826 stop:2104 length:279 start_codon:yes stop_codon:yes gene_type:complete